MREFRLLQHVYGAAGVPDPRVIIAPGDDMAQLRLDGPDLLAAVDQVVGGLHFDPDHTALELIGRKAVTRSLSDVAAMAGSPRGSLVAVCLPGDLGEPAACTLFDAMHATAAQFNCPLVGGDISIHDGPLVASVTVLAEPTRPTPLTRTGARPGDGLYVTGTLGGAVRSGRHLTFTPRIDEAIALAAMLGDRLHAMIDVSDGLGRDAGHLAVDVRIEIDAERVPCSADAGDWRAALSEGEDYELCFAAAGDVPERIEGLPVTRVGDVLTGETGAFVRDADTIVPAGGLGWQHES